ncbi:hypothetical protein GXW82_43955 [Streptacidiphilus sp. 4-A2]|nr:hypothetical protein [Streptacidiphilus sp. 4-A2]
MGPVDLEPAARPRVSPRRVPRIQPALRPLAVPIPALVAVADSCALVVEACYTLKHGKQQDLISALAVTGRANTFIAGHVPGELVEHLPRLAAHYQVPVDQALRLLAGGILPATRAVDLEIRDHLAPRTRHLLRDDPELAKRHRGDPDDAPTMALAELHATGRCRAARRSSARRCAERAGRAGRGAGTAPCCGCGGVERLSAGGAA